MFKKFLNTMGVIALGLLIAGYILLTVPKASGAKEYEPVTLTRLATNNSYAINEIVDNETGVCYLFVSGSYKAGLTVMYNADGTLKVKK